MANSEPNTHTPPPRVYRRLVEECYPTDEFGGGVTPACAAAELDVSARTARTRLRQLADSDHIRQIQRPNGIAFCPLD